MTPMTLAIGMVLVVLAGFLAYALYDDGPVFISCTDTQPPARCEDTRGRLEQLGQGGRWHQVQLEGLYDEIDRLEATVAWHTEQQEAEWVECCELLGVDPYKASYPRDLCKSVIEGSDPGEVMERVARSRE